VAFDPAIFKEELGTAKPVVKIELNDAIKLKIAASTFADERNSHCCLERPISPDDVDVSFYHFFRNLIIVNSGNLSADEFYNPGINVHVEGMKNFLVENDDSIQDPGGSIVVFGVRPKVGSSFYVGSGEIFSKNWQNIILHGDWKNLPRDFKEHYKFYNALNFEDGSLELNNASFKANAAVLEGGDWKLDNIHRLFKDTPADPDDPLWSNHIYIFPRSLFSGSAYVPGKAAPPDLSGRVSLARNGFLRLSLEKPSFQHEYYAFELARQLMKLAEMVDPVSMSDAAQKVVLAKLVTAQLKARVENIATLAAQVQGKIANSFNLLFPDTNNPPTDGLLPLANDLLAAINAANAALPGDVPGAQAQLAIANPLIANILARLGSTATPNTIAADINDINGLMGQIDQLLNNTTFPFNETTSGALELLNVLILILDFIQDDLNITDPDEVGLPKEPYTPTFKQLQLEYYAIAEMDDIDLIHLYPFAGTYKAEGLQLRPALLPTFCNEGHLFLGLENLVPGSTLTILFKLAEATADSESPEQDVMWQYLDNNSWKLLRNGLEILSDETDDLTTTGIVKFALPRNMTKGNTVAPGSYHWIRAVLPKGTRAVSEILSIHTQAVTVKFNPSQQNDLLRLAKPLPAGTISRLDQPDAAIKLLSQPYDSFGGQVPEIQNNFYVRVAELLRHKGRAIQRWDYERLTLEKFPEVFKAKCITHSFGLNAGEYINDFPMAPGYVIFAVIPNLEILSASKSYQPKLPASILFKIEDYLKTCTSPFVRLKAMNPRYEAVDFCLKIKLLAGKDPTFYKEVLIRELREFMAPWAIGQYQKLRFGQCINRSDVIQFLESRNYVDFIIDLKMSLQDDTPAQAYEICPATPRSILIAGEIDICVPPNACDEFDKKNPCTKKPVTVGLRRS
ncbi:MAG: hypothetical protein JNK79_00420, partial [Chitinophagaceae bacterium]|nr:hypothetical protein [Chitinophagaceae bacterium]